MSVPKKILCTLGPASMNDRVIARLTDVGVSLFRINLSHTKIKDLPEVIKFIQSRTKVPVCLDSEGAQIRTGDFLDIKILLEENQIIKIPRQAVEGSGSSFNLYPLDCVDKIEVGDIVSIDFNSVLVKVIAKDQNGLVIKVLTGGFIGRNKAVSVDREIDLPALTEKDIQAFAIGKKMGIKHVALSFANKAEDIDELKKHVAPQTYIISKIESLMGIKNLEAIAGRSHALLLDRGDMSRQVPIEQIPRVQKEIIRRAKQANVEMFVATNLLESMITMSNPTRAEVNDIFNTLVDGADGLVLAAETAIGSYPVECASMVSRVMQQFHEYCQGPNGFLENLDSDDHSFLIKPHGGELIHRYEDSPDLELINAYKKIVVEEKDLINAEQIAIGAFSPLKGFMSKEELDGVLKDFKLPTGVIWPMPIVLQIDQKNAEQLSIGQKVALCFKNDGLVYAILDIKDIYTYDLQQLTSQLFGTNDSKHPGVEDILKRPNHFLGGEITLIKRLPSQNKQFEMTPRQVRKIFEHKGWSRIIGFHTRNVAHRVHEHIQKTAIEKYHCDGIFIHPLSGPKKKGDYLSEIILKSYEIIISKYYPAHKVLLAAWLNYPRYAGPREAVFTAICRKNYGCSHFVVGRDHSGIEGYYQKDSVRQLFESLGDIGIEPIFFNEINYCRKCESYVETCDHKQEDILSISGTQGRKMLMDKNLPPEWFMRKDLSELIINQIDAGKEIFQE